MSSCSVGRWTVQSAQSNKCELTPDDGPSTLLTVHELSSTLAVLEDAAVDIEPMLTAREPTIRRPEASEQINSTGETVTVYPPNFADDCECWIEITDTLYRIRSEDDANKLFEVLHSFLNVTEHGG